MSNYQFPYLSPHQSRTQEPTPVAASTWRPPSKAIFAKGAQSPRRTWFAGLKRVAGPPRLDGGAWNGGELQLQPR